MPAQPFSVHLNLDDLARRDIAAALHRTAQPDDTSTGQPSDADSAHHGARDSRQAARRQSGRDRSGRAASAGSGRSYAFRRS
ncbi:MULTISPECIES: hypothetical protein [Actinoplanes]|uniref:hypothetical protein n=1 Tax=Actinoplanes TaxID=1865 RepID=UPI0005F2F33C|nr:MULTISPECIES: hypothetical protein [Actinoplanes]GLY00075.1 hypothetical protein Acsp01_04540 [Actinoplanes sp. NBRC 101535]